MSAIPLHLQRRFEQRWAAKLAWLVPSAVPKGISLKRAAKSSPRPAKAKEEPAGLMWGGGLESGKEFSSSNQKFRPSIKR